MPPCISARITLPNEITITVWGLRIPRKVWAPTFSNKMIPYIDMFRPFVFDWIFCHRNCYLVVFNGGYRLHVVSYFSKQLFQPYDLLGSFTQGNLL